MEVLGDTSDPIPIIKLEGVSEVILELPDSSTILKNEEGYPTRYYYNGGYLEDSYDEIEPGYKLIDTENEEIVLESDDWVISKALQGEDFKDEMIITYSININGPTNISNKDKIQPVTRKVKLIDADAPILIDENTGKEHIEENIINISLNKIEDDIFELKYTEKFKQFDNLDDEKLLDDMFKFISDNASLYDEDGEYYFLKEISDTNGNTRRYKIRYNIMNNRSPWIRYAGSNYINFKDLTIGMMAMDIDGYDNESGSDDLTIEYYFEHYYDGIRYNSSKASEYLPAGRYTLNAKVTDPQGLSNSYEFDIYVFDNTTSDDFCDKSCVKSLIENFYEYYHENPDGELDVLFKQLPEGTHYDFDAEIWYND